MPRSRSAIGNEPVHLLVDSTGLKLCGAGEWLVENTAPRSIDLGGKLQTGMDANSDAIIAAALTTNDIDDASQVSRL